MAKPSTGDLEALFTAEQIHDRVRELGAQISRDLEGKVPLMVGVLKGAFVFLADLVRAMTIPVEVDFVRLSSYGGRTQSSGRIRVLGEVATGLAGRDVVLVEDIVDTGLTLSHSIEQLRALRPATVRVCALARKSGSGAKMGHVDYLGFDALEGFLVGYGLDHAERFRELPGLYRLK